MAIEYAVAEKIYLFSLVVDFYWLVECLWLAFPSIGYFYSVFCMSSRFNIFC